MVCIAAVAVGLRRHAHGAARTLVTLAAGITFFAAGDLLWALRNAYGVTAVPDAASDVAYVAAYVPFLWSLLRLTASRREERDDLGAPEPLTAIDMPSTAPEPRRASRRPRSLARLRDAQDVPSAGATQAG